MGLWDSISNWWDKGGETTDTTTHNGDVIKIAGKQYYAGDLIGKSFVVDSPITAYTDTRSGIVYHTFAAGETVGTVDSYVLSSGTWLTFLDAFGTTSYYVAADDVNTSTLNKEQTMDVEDVTKENAENANPMVALADGAKEFASDIGGFLNNLTAPVKWIIISGVVICGTYFLSKTNISSLKKLKKYVR